MMGIAIARSDLITNEASESLHLSCQARYPAQAFSNEIVNNNKKTTDGVMGSKSTPLSVELDVLALSDVQNEAHVKIYPYTYRFLGDGVVGTADNFGLEGGVKGSESSGCVLRPFLGSPGWLNL